MTKLSSFCQSCPDADCPQALTENNDSATTSPDDVTSMTELIISIVRDNGNDIDTSSQESD